MWWEFKWPLWNCTQSLCPSEWGHKLKRDSPLLPVQAFTNGLIMRGGSWIGMFSWCFTVGWAWQPLINYCPVLISHIRFLSNPHCVSTMVSRVTEHCCRELILQGDLLKNSSSTSTAWWKNKMKFKKTKKIIILGS